MTTLISLLGKGQNPKTGYRLAKYRFSPEVVHEVPFFGLGLLEYLKPDRLILTGTAGSMWDVFFDHQQPDDDNILSLVEAVEAEKVTPEMLIAHEQRLSGKFGIPVQCLLIPYARNEQEQATILSALATIVQPDENIVLDVTHGFRHLPMLALVAARYLTHIQKVNVQDLYYGALEMTDRATGETPVLRLGAMLTMLDWIEAMASYDQSGNYGVFSELLKADGMNADLANMLAQAAFFERCSNPVQAKESINGVFEYVDEHQGPLGRLFKDTLTKRIKWSRTGSRGDWELKLSDNYLQRKDYLRAIIYLYEAYISRLVKENGGDPNEFKYREDASSQAKEKQDARLLKRLRNAVAHGVRSNDEKVKTLLQNEDKLNRQLRQLRKKIFG